MDNLLTNHHPSVVTYIREILHPLVNRLSEFKIIESLKAWVARNLPELSFKINSSLYQLDLNTATQEIYKYIISIFVGAVTQWDILSKIKTNNILTRLLPTHNINPPVVISYKNTTYQHNISEELLYGIIITLRNSISLHDYKFKICGEDISLELLDIKYLNSNAETKYTCHVLSNNQPLTVKFNTKDFVRGVVTASSWININPHTIIIDITKRTTLGDCMAISFSVNL